MSVHKMHNDKSYKPLNLAINMLRLAFLFLIIFYFHLAVLEQLQIKLPRQLEGQEYKSNFLFLHYKQNDPILIVPVSVYKVVTVAAFYQLLFCQKQLVLYMQDFLSFVATNFYAIAFFLFSLLVVFY